MAEFFRSASLPFLPSAYNSASVNLKNTGYTTIHTVPTGRYMTVKQFYLYITAVTVGGGAPPSIKLIHYDSSGSVRYEMLAEYTLTETVVEQMLEVQIAYNKVLVGGDRVEIQVVTGSTYTTFTGIARVEGSVL